MVRPTIAGRSPAGPGNFLSDLLLFTVGVGGAGLVTASGRWWLLLELPAGGTYKTEFVAVPELKPEAF